MGLFKRNEKTQKTILQMVNTYGEHFIAYDGKLYNSDIVRSCIRPKVQAIGKLSAKHIRGSGMSMQVNPERYIRFLLEEPNPFMTMQELLERFETQLMLNNNAFILKVRDDNGKIIQLYPIPCITAETVYKENELWLKFTFRNGKTNSFPYSEIIHQGRDFNSHDIFGDSPAPALAQMMEVVTTIDQGLIKAIKNSGVIRWLLKYTQSLRPEDLKKNVQDFVTNFLSVDSETMGAAGVDSKAEAIRIEPKDYVPNAVQSKDTINRIRLFFNTNEKIVSSNFTEDEWNAYYEAEVEPDVIRLCNGFTNGLFNRVERDKENRIVFEAANLAYASLATKLNFVQMVDRGAMTPNEWRATMNMAPIEGGDKPIRRLDTQVVALASELMDMVNSENHKEITAVVKKILTMEEREEDETQN